ILSPSLRLPVVAAASAVSISSVAGRRLKKLSSVPKKYLMRYRSKTLRSSWTVDSGLRNRQDLWFSVGMGQYEQLNLHPCVSRTLAIGVCERTAESSNGAGRRPEP